MFLQLVLSIALPKAKWTLKKLPSMQAHVGLQAIVASHLLATLRTLKCWLAMHRHVLCKTELAHDLPLAQFTLETLPDVVHVQQVFSSCGVMFEDLFAVRALCVEGFFLVDQLDVVREHCLSVDTFSTEVTHVASPMSCSLVNLKLIQV